MTTEPIPAPDAAARAQLEAMAARGGQNGVRARIVLALARGEAPTRSSARPAAVSVGMTATTRLFARSPFMA